MYEIRITYELSDQSYFKWRQMINSIPKTWKKLLKENQSDSSNLVLLDHQLLIISSKVNITTSRTYFEKKIPLYNFQWKDICTLPRKVTINPYLI